MYQHYACMKPDVCPRLANNFDVLDCCSVGDCVGSASKVKWCKGGCFTIHLLHLSFPANFCSSQMSMAGLCGLCI